MPTPLAGKTALVTGSTRRGIGAATAMVLAAKGANLVLNYGTGGKGPEARERAESLARQIQAPGRRVTIVEASIAVEDEVREMFRQAEELHGGVDILVNNAGGAWLEQDFAAIDTAHWNQAIRSEVDGTFYCIRQALPAMRRRRWGRIINIGLDPEAMALLIHAQYGHPLDRFPYDFTLAKFAKQQMSRLLALAELKHGITINNVLPGIIEEIDNTEALDRVGGKPASPVFFDPVDVALAVAFLCLEEARGITGSELRLPGNIYTRL